MAMTEIGERHTGKSRLIGDIDRPRKLPGIELTISNNTLLLLRGLGRKHEGVNIRVIAKEGEDHINELQETVKVPEGSSCIDVRAETDAAFNDFWQEFNAERAKATTEAEAEAV